MLPHALRYLLEANMYYLSTEHLGRVQSRAIGVHQGTGGPRRLCRRRSLDWGAQRSRSQGGVSFALCCKYRFVT